MVKYVRGAYMNIIRAVVTYKCNFMCSNCNLKCGPYKKGIMKVDEFDKNIRNSYKRGIYDLLLIEGGEPFLYAGMLYKYIKKTSDINLKKYIATNGYWGNIEPFNVILGDLKSAGLNGIIIEYDCYHSMFTDTDTIKCAIEKCKINGIKVFIRSNFNTNGISEKCDELTFNLIKELKREFKKTGFIFNTTDKAIKYDISKNNNDVVFMYNKY